MTTKATTTTRTHHNCQLAAVRRAVLRSGNRRTKQLRKVGESINYAASASSGQASTGSAQAGFTLATSTSYNSLGQKSSTTYPDGAVYSYTYDSNNQLNILNLPTGYGSITINSYLWSAPAQITLPGGTVRSQTFDGLLRLKDLNVKDPGQSQVMSYQYRYDATNNIVAKATEAGTTNYSYDTLDRLTGANYTAATGATATLQAGSTSSPQATEAYSYDPVANRLTQGAAGSPQAILSYTYNENNQLLSAGGSTGSPTGSTGSPTVSYSYDANGNTVSQSDSSNTAATRNYVYDTSDRLVEVRDGSNALIAVYSYDPFGRRLSKDTGTKKIYFLYNEEGLIAEADASGQLTKSYGYAPQSSFTTNPLWMKSGNGSTGSAQAYYTYQNDHLGTPQKLLTQSGQTVWSATYDSYGNATIDPAYTIVNNLRYPGQYYDQETGLHYNWMRYYDPRTVGGGRYITSDPIGLRGGVNFYTYVGGNPLRWIDSKGLASCTFTMSTGRLICVPSDAKNAPVNIQVASGNNGDNRQCRNNPACTATPNHGPIPTGCWRWTNGGTSKPNGRVLEPCSGTNTNVTENRTLIRSHSCANPFGPGVGPQFCSEGCVTGTALDIQELNVLIDAEPNSTLQVVP